MEADKVYKSFVEIAKYYLKELDYYGKYQFTLHPISKQWSMGQLYDHLIHGTTAFYIRKIQDCLEKKNGAEDGAKNFKGKMVFLFKSFPFEVKGLDSENYPPKQPESPAKVKDDLYRFLKVVNRIAKDIDSKGSLSYKTEHPTLGMLNALEWFKLLEIHFNHQVKFKKKLDMHVRSLRKELAAEQE